MSIFLQIPPLRIGRSGEWILIDNLVYKSDLWDREIRVPAGFKTDLASIPRLSQPLIPINGKHRAAAIVHDYLYSLRGHLPSSGRFTRKAADDLFLEAMKASGVIWWRHQLMYAAVRIGGWSSWG